MGRWNGTVTGMGERALAVLFRPDGSIELYRAQWGGSRRVLGGVLEAENPADRHGALCSVAWSCRDGLPDDVFEGTLDYLGLAAVYAVSGSGIDVYIPLWFGLPGADGPTDPRLGALVEVEGIEAARRCRARCRYLKGVLEAGLDEGLLTVPDALGLLRRGVCGHPSPSLRSATAGPINRG